MLNPLNVALEDVKSSLTIGHYEIEFGTGKTLISSRKSFYMRGMTLETIKINKKVESVKPNFNERLLGVPFCF